MSPRIFFGSNGKPWKTECMDIPGDRMRFSALNVMVSKSQESSRQCALEGEVLSNALRASCTIELESIIELRLHGKEWQE